MYNLKLITCVLRLDGLDEENGGDGQDNGGDGLIRILNKPALWLLVTQL